MTIQRKNDPETSFKFGARDQAEGQFIAQILKKSEHQLNCIVDPWPSETNPNRVAVKCLDDLSHWNVRALYQLNTYCSGIQIAYRESAKEGKVS